MSHLSTWNFPVYFFLKTVLPGFSPLSPLVSTSYLQSLLRSVFADLWWKYTFRFYPCGALTVLGSKDNRLYVDLDLDQGNFLCLIDWKFLLPLSFKRFIGLKNYGLISSFFTKLKGKVRISMGFQSTDRSEKTVF